MKHYFPFIVLLITSIGSGVLFYNFCASSSPEVTSINKLSTDTQKEALQIVPEIYDFGIVGEGDKVIIPYKFINKSNSIITIDKIVPACTCIIADENWKNTLAFGESTEIRFDFDTDGRPGKHTKETKVKYHIGQNKPLFARMKMTGRILAKLLVSPALVDFNKVKYGQTHEQKVQIISEMIPKFSIQLSELESGNSDNCKKIVNQQISASYTQLALNHYEVLLTFKPDSGLASGSASIKIENDISEEKNIRLCRKTLF